MLNTSAAVDFATALARLLRDGKARDKHRADAAALAKEWRVGADDMDDFIALDPGELETQAVVLLRKRFDQAARLIPRTLAALGDRAWPMFREYARVHWHADDENGYADLCGFCMVIRRQRPSTLCMTEWNRLRFLHGTGHAAIHFTLVPSPSQPRRALQLLFRRRNGAWREFLVYSN